MSALHVVLVCCLFLSASLAQSPCVSRSFGQNSVVCVCNATYCDELEPINEAQLAGELAFHYLSTMSGDRFLQMKMNFSTTSTATSFAVTFTVDRKTKYQEIFGFGGAVTDSAAINIQSLGDNTKERLLKSYFGKQGINYSFLRVPVGGSDFSRTKYSYDDNHDGDTDLKFFNLTDDDLLYKIPVIKRAKQLREEATAGTKEDPSVKLFSAPWSAPDWMKHIDNKTGGSYLLPKYYSVWANYYLKFFQMYREHNVEFWGLTPQNEPTNGVLSGGFNTMGWQPADLREWTIANLMPTLKANGFGNITLMVHDNQRTYALRWCKVLLSNETSNKLASGIAVHWYGDTDNNAYILDEIHSAYSDKFILYTEASIMHKGSSIVHLGSWDRAEKYAKDILQVVNHWSTGWVDWNMVLNQKGGPSWYGNSADSPIIVNTAADLFYKQPMFYAIGHVSAFVPPGSSRVSIQASANKNIENAAFLRPDGVVVIVFLNTNTAAVEAEVKDSSKGYMKVNLPARSISTVLYK